MYVGNFAGAIATAALVSSRVSTSSAAAPSGSRPCDRGGQDVLGFGQAVVLGTLCNALVCLAVWLTYSARTVADKILAVVPPIAAFVAAGFEHSVANMYFIPFSSSRATWTAVGPSTPQA